MSESTNPFHKWATSSDSEWLTAMLESLTEPEIDGIRFPQFPSEETQRFIQGASADIAVRGAHCFYEEAKLAAVKNDRPFEPDGVLLDFGSGWGRTIRPFMRHFDLRNMFGCEPSVEWCMQARALNPFLTFVNSPYEPPLIFKDEAFDYITAYSIFTHLPVYLFREWFQEFWRLLKPGGLVLFTMMGIRMVQEVYAEARAGKEMHFWHKILADNLGDSETVQRQLNAGELLFLRTQNSDNYGDTFLSPDFIRGELGGRFEIAHLNLRDLAQDFCAVRKL
jgi:SAM-dependent methyltransferase